MRASQKVAVVTGARKESGRAWSKASLPPAIGLWRTPGRIGQDRANDPDQLGRLLIACRCPARAPWRVRHGRAGSGASPIGRRGASSQRLAGVTAGHQEHGAVARLAQATKLGGEAAPAWRRAPPQCNGSRRARVGPSFLQSRRCRPAPGPISRRLGAGAAHWLTWSPAAANPIWPFFWPMRLAWPAPRPTATNPAPS
jgi:hypothetical protein